MKKFTKIEMLPELFSGKKFKAVEWQDDNFVEVSNGQVVTDEGVNFDVMNADEAEWVLWVKPIKTGVISKEEALKALYEGKSVKAKDWTDEVIFVKDGQIMINGAKPFNIMTAEEKEWVIIEEEARGNEHEEIAELKSMIAKLLKNDEKEKEKDGRSVEVQESTTELLKAVYGVTTPKQIEKQFFDALDGANSTKDIEKTVCEYIPYCWIGGRTVGTTSVYYANMRNIIKKIGNENYRDLALSLFLPPKGFYEMVQSGITENKKEAIRDRNTFNPKFINELLAKLKTKILSDDFSDKPRQTDEAREKAYYYYSYLTVATGRRQTEILKTLEIKKAKKGFEFDGLLKKRESDESKIEAFALDDDFSFLTKLVKYVQEHIDAKSFTEKEINSKFNNPFNNALKRITGTNFTAKEWRDIYAEMMWYMNDAKTKSNIDKRDYKAKILGHENDGKLSATEHYDVWEAIDEE